MEIPFWCSVSTVKRNDVVSDAHRVESGSGAENVGWESATAGNQIIGGRFPADFAVGAIEGVDVAGFPVGSDIDDIICNQRVAVKLPGAVSGDVVDPDRSAIVLVEGVEDSGTRTDEDEVPRDRGGGEDSAAGGKSPQHLAWGRRRRSGENRPEDHDKESESRTLKSHSEVPTIHYTYRLPRRSPPSR